MIHNLLDDPVIEYICPVHPEIVSEKSGNCPKCGMTLDPKGVIDHVMPGVKAPEHDNHAGHTAGSFLRIFWISLALSIPIVLYSDLPRILFGFTMHSFRGVQYLAPVFGSAIFFYAGWVFLLGAFNELRAKLPGMMTLVSLAIISAYGYSMYTFFTRGVHAFFGELATLITVMLLGHYLEMKSVGMAQHVLQGLADLLPDTAEILSGVNSRVAPLSELMLGDRVAIRSGSTIPADGVVVEGESQVNESMITGESAMVAKRVDSLVVAGTINGDGHLVVRVNTIGEETFLAGVMRLGANAQASKSQPQALADRVAFHLTWIAIVAALVTVVTWLLLGMGTSFALERLIAVLVVVSPHALWLAIPLVVAISTSIASRNGLFIKDRLALESARTINVVLFDKTGVLTTGEYGIYKIIPLDDSASKEALLESRAEENILRLAASIDTASEHPVSRAIVKEAAQREIPLFPVTGFERIPGKGVKGTVRGLRVEVGGEALVGAKVIEQIPRELHQEVALLAGKGQTIIYVVVDHSIVGIISLADVIRPESKEAIAKLKRLGIKPIMVTGDSEEVAEWVAQDIGIEDYFFRISPHEKVEKVKQYQAQGLRVAMVGDGINDAPALTQANIGIAIGASTNVAIESAGIILAKSDPRDIAKIFMLSRLTYQKMIQNLWWAAGYNIIAIPLAAGVLYTQGIVLSPAISAAFMSLSTIVVAANALQLRRREKTL